MTTAWSCASTARRRWRRRLPSQSATVGSVVSFTVTASDVDGDALTYVADDRFDGAADCAWHRPGSSPGTRTGYSAGTYQLTYFATDGLAQSATQTVTITLTSGRAAVPPASGGGGGGGALPWLQLLLLGALLVAPTIRQREALVRAPNRRPRRSGAPAARPQRRASRRSGNASPRRLLQRDLDPAADEQCRRQPQRARSVRGRALTSHVGCAGEKQRVQHARQSAIPRDPRIEPRQSRADHQCR